MHVGTSYVHLQVFLKIAWKESTPKLRARYFAAKKKIVMQLLVFSLKPMLAKKKVSSPRHQLQHGLASVSEKELTQDAWPRVQHPNHIPPELLKDFDHSLLIPDGKHLVLPSRITHCVSCRWCFARLTCSSTRSCAMPGSVHGVWCCFLASLSCNASPTLLNITWKQMQDG